MKKIVITALAAFAVQMAALCAAYAQEPEDIIIETLLPDGSTNTWTRTDLVAALGLINRKYHRDVDTKTGTIQKRKDWHGRLVTEIVDTNALTRTQIYEDGMTFVDPWASHIMPKPPPAPDLNAQGVPKALAEARARRKQEKATTNVVDNVISAGGEVQ